LKKLGLNLSKKEIEDIVNMVPDSIEKVLLALKVQIEYKLSNKSAPPRHQNPNIGGKENSHTQNFNAGYDGQ